MLVKGLLVGAVALAFAAPAAAQLEMRRGTMEFGAFASGARFDNALSLSNAVGGGGRVGMYLDHRLSVEFEDAEMRAKRPGGLEDVNVGILSGRLVVSDRKRGPFMFLVGAGAGVSTETNFLHSYGWDFLAGVKMPINDHASFRVDGVFDWLANNGQQTYQTIRAGVSWYRAPADGPRK